MLRVMKRARYIKEKYVAYDVERIKLKYVGRFGQDALIIFYDYTKSWNQNLEMKIEIMLITDGDHHNGCRPKPNNVVFAKTGHI